MNISKWMKRCSPVSSILIFVVGIFTGIFLYHYGYSELEKLWQIVKAHWINFTLALAAVISAIYAHRSNRRAEQLFMGQRRPILQVRPVAIKDYPEFPAVETSLSIVNFSGFLARNISFDLKYGDYGWCGEWLRADMDNKQVSSNVSGKCYTISEVIIDELRPAQSYKASIRGSLDLNKVCNKKELPVYIKARWANESNFIFEKIWQYTLICTSVGGGKSIDFVLSSAEINQLNKCT